MFRCTTICLLLLADPIAGMAVGAPSDSLTHQLERVTSKMPRSTSTLSLVAYRKREIAKQMAQLQAKYDAANNATYTEALKKAKERLAKQQEECEHCEAAEGALDLAYEDSLTAHKKVEAVAAEVEAILKADSVHQDAYKNVTEAEIQTEAYKQDTFKAAKDALLAANEPWACGDSSTIGDFDPLDGDGEIKFVNQPLITGLNDAAEVLRNMQRNVEAKKGVEQAKLAALEKTKRDSVECTPHEFCTPIHLEGAKSASAAKDQMVEGKIKTRNDECAAIKVVPATPAIPTYSFVAAGHCVSAEQGTYGCFGTAACKNNQIYFPGAVPYTSELYYDWVGEAKLANPASSEECEKLCNEYNVATDNPFPTIKCWGFTYKNQWSQASCFLWGGPEGEAPTWPEELPWAQQYTTVDGEPTGCYKLNE